MLPAAARPERDDDHVVEVAEREDRAANPGDSMRGIIVACPSTNHVIAVINAPAKIALQESARTPFACTVEAVSTLALPCRTAARCAS
jgi:hypothetical protein